MWRSTPSEFKEFTVKHILFKQIFRKLYDNDTENFKLILESAELTEEVDASLVQHFILQKILSSLMK